VLGDALEKAGQGEESLESFKQAIALATNENEKKMLSERLSVSHNQR
jgi:predicted RNA polymerase sigma factor